jgi:hypothetical protein
LVLSCDNMDRPFGWWDRVLAAIGKD